MASTLTNFSSYQSTTGASLDASENFNQEPAFEYDLSGNKTPNEIRFKSSDALHTLDERTALTGNGTERDDVVAKTMKKTPFLIYTIISTLFFGFSLGFSFGYYASERGLFKMNNNVEQTSDITLPSMDKDLVEKGKKALEFMDKFFFKDSITEGADSALLSFSLGSSPSTPKVRPLVYLNRPDAYGLLIDSTPGLTSISAYSNDFFLISSGLDAQINQAYCGVAAAVGILNSLRFIKSTDSDSGVDIPTDPVYKPYPYATQEDVFDVCTEQTVISHTGGGQGIDGILTPPYGLSLSQVEALLNCHLQSTKGSSWTVTAQNVDDTHQTVAKMKFDLKNALMDTNSRVLVNYDRSKIGQNGSGHWAPVGSYSDTMDAFLLLEVAKYKYPSVWVPSERLFDGMSTTDDCGEWNFPVAQDTLSQEERSPTSPAEYATTTAKLGCKSELRGYIIISKS